MDLKGYTKRYDFYRSVAIKLCKSIEIGEELVQELFLILIKKDQDLLDRLLKDQKAEAYCIRIMKTQLFSKNTKFYKREISWKKNRSTESVKDQPDVRRSESDFLDMINAEKVDLLIKRLPYFQREVFRVYYEGGISFTKFSEESGIARKTLYNTIQKVKKYIKENYKHELDSK